ncbi:uncharacterized protein LOC114858703 [Betta splendens]|uniref:Uncharacterized protein LOC114858703 n=1 Tax=Betta splendens TaxID=158456 RepID=A0A9W2XX96_BETSP|nr:uncharacterized protein LOC114858703 [Betta splendens]
MEKLLSKQLIPQNLGTFGAIVVMFTYSILLDRDIDCTCKQQDNLCYVYLFVPGCLIWVLMLWTRKTFLQICRKCYCCKFFCFLCKDIFKSLLIGLLWVAFVLIDGDWYVCCWNDHSTQQAQLSCKTPADLTYEDRVIIAELKNKSRILGISLLAAIVGLAAIMSWFEWRRLCQREAPKRKREGCCLPSKCCNTEGSKCCKTEGSKCSETEGSKCCNTEGSKCCNTEGSKCSNAEGSQRFEKLICCYREGSNCCKKEESISSRNKNIYYKMILKEEEKVLKEILRESSKSQLTEGIKGKICGEQWTECFDVAKSLIKEQKKPKLDGEGRCEGKRGEGGEGGDGERAEGGDGGMVGGGGDCDRIGVGEREGDRGSVGEGGGGGDGEQIGGEAGREG